MAGGGRPQLIAGVGLTEVEYNVMDYSELFDSIAYESYARQWALDRKIGEFAWELDPTSASLLFSDGSSFETQFIGTHSEISESWRWADANPSAELPEHAVALVRQVRQELCDCIWFTKDEFEIPSLVGAPTPEGLAAIASTRGKPCFSMGLEHTDGTIYVGLDGSPISHEYTLAWFEAAFQAMMWTPGDHLSRIHMFARSNSAVTLVEDTPGRTVLGFADGGRAVVDYSSTPDGGVEMSFSAQP